MTELLERYKFIRGAIPPVFFLWTVLMLALTLMPSESIPDIKVFSYDKIGHFGLFGGWTFFLGLYFIVYREKTNINLVLLMFAGILFGVFIELMQFLLPGSRSASWGDVIANSLGCLTAWLLLRPIRDYLKKSN